jgi:hypothetical protein
MVDFGNLCRVVAETDNADAALAIYKGFGLLLEQYNLPQGFQGGYSHTDFDFYKFLGHELFVTFLSFLIAESRWELVADILEDGIYVENAEHGQPQMVTFTFISQLVQLLWLGNERGSGVRVHADLLNERHTQGAIAEIVPMQQFLAADYFLFLRSRLQGEEVDVNQGWAAWSIIHMGRYFIPKYLIEAVVTKHAKQLVRPFGVDSVEILRARFKERVPPLHTQFKAMFPMNFAVDRFDPQTIGSR